MILFDDWTIRSAGGLLARQYDNLSRELVVSGVPEGYDWTVMVQVGKNFDKLALEPMEGGVGLTLTAEQLAVAGYYQLQLVGTLQSDGVTTRHTNVLREFVPESLSGDANWPELPSAFTQLEANLRELSEHPAIPGENGFWLTWDLESHAYVESAFPLPASSSGAVGQDGITPTIGENGNWYLGETDTGVKAAGTDGKDGETGAQGPQGEKGDTGADGKTPVKGVDYFTDEDKAELVQDVLTQFENAEEASW